MNTYVWINYDEMNEITSEIISPRKERKLLSFRIGSTFYLHKVLEKMVSERGKKIANSDLVQ